MKKLLLSSILVIFIAAKSFSIAPNDSCQSALLLTVTESGNEPALFVDDLNLSSNATLMTICTVQAYSDLWYYFVATNDTQVVFFKSLTSGLLPEVEILTGNCGALTSIICYGSTNSKTLTALTPGQTYYIRTHYFIGGPKYQISLLNVPSNDECSGAYNLTVYRPDQPFIGGLYFWTAANNVGANPCNASYDYDIWFKFTATDTAQVLYVDGINAYIGYEVMDGTCGSLIAKQCGDFPNTDHAKFHNLTIGQQYYFRLSTYSYNPAPIYKVALLNPVVNDYCAGAITIPVSASFEDDTEISGDLWFGFSSPGVCNTEGDLWYKFTANSSSAFIKVQSFKPMSFSLYSGNCAALTNVQCSIPVNAKVTGLTSGDTYYIQLHSTLTEQQYFNIAVTPILNNDDCSGAISVIAGDKLYAEHAVEATTFSATQSQPGCAGNADDDVWFSFTANRSNYVLDVTPDDLNLYAYGFTYELFSGTCGALVSIKCDTVVTDKLDQVKNLTIGQTYYLRLYTRFANQYGHFKLAIYRSIDECVDAEDLILTTNPSDLNAPIYNTIGASQSMPGCTQNADDDVWFSFTATQTSHSFIASNFYTNFSPIIEAFSGTCASLTSLNCAYQQGNITGLTPGQKYYLRAYYPFAGSISRFKLRVFQSPPNDEISNARRIPITNEYVIGLTGQLTAGALPSYPNYCTGSTITVVEDVWYYFVAPQTAKYLADWDNISAGEFAIEAYSSNSNLQSNLINCGVIPVLIPQTGTINAGDTVWLRVYPTISGGSYKGDFDLSVYVYPAGNTNDEATDALPLDFNNSYQYTYQSLNYTLSTVTNSCLTTVASNSDSWFKFTVPALHASVVVDEANTGKSLLELFSGTPGSLTSVECSDNILNLSSALTVGQQYYLRVLHKADAAAFRIGIFYNDTLERNNSVAVHCLGPNLVPNPGAECLTCNTACKSELVYTGTELAGYYNTDDWFMPTDGSSDYYNSCGGTSVGNATNAPTTYLNVSGSYYLWSDIVPRNGKGYLGLFTYASGNYREYVSTQLTQTMTVGNSYLVSFYVAKNYNSPLLTNQIGAVFTTDKILITNNSATNIASNNLPFEPQVAWNDSFYVGSDRWYNVSGIFVADKPYRYLTIGNFETNNGTSIQNTGSPAPAQFVSQSISYFNIDDVVVAEVPAVIDDSCKATVTAIHEVKPPVKSTLLIYPNPASSSVSWGLNQLNKEDFTVEVFSLTGQIIYKTKTKTNTISVANYIPGIYFIRINDGINYYSGKFAKE